MSVPSNVLLNAIPNIERLEMCKLLSPTAISNIYTMGCTAKVDPRQALPSNYTMPREDTRRLRLRLCVEEVVCELADALGFQVVVKPKGLNASIPVELEHLRFDAAKEPDMEKAIDACIDGIYVLVGTLCAMGVPDVPHMALVNRCNDLKFPGGKAIADENGKFGKPEGWQPPNHAVLADSLPHKPNFGLLAERLLKAAAEPLAGTPHPVSDPDFVLPPNTMPRPGDYAAEHGVPPEHTEHGNVQSGHSSCYDAGAEGDCK
jgi:predicted HAD superfamily Cof-like phosphohydrolase